ncbi:ribosome silencing factor [Flammeovirga kamogawensis]|uniref:Ribosomal silencing factor RsfS n=1 Tax=Flammeovirga kamogawensis TaxID=373891 RepID=A0ABX8GUA4_9BACT|nr:ribosome silencing factor [Flammeovirga kamogawensis]MBB6462990.1 ribosome-associated protein [Flammeovirga kamogawensis]QWG06515.1 ribosome silencing factor [Flammeovirga kamogawensis]TRX68343.1 ribosome silencing factor [Flammeovirga kamogawensis]
MKDKSVGAEELAHIVAKGMQEIKAQNIEILDLRKVKNGVTDFFVICTASSDTQLDSIKDSIEKEVKDTVGEKPWATEGVGTQGWALLDYINVVAHVFLPKKREFYALEELWGDAKVFKLPNQ